MKYILYIIYLIDIHNNLCMYRNLKLDRLCIMCSREKLSLVFKCIHKITFYLNKF